MAEHLHDDEQVEALRRWWQENGRSTIVAVVLAVGGTLGWQQYQGWEQGQREAASDAWASVQIRLESPDPAQQAAARVAAEDIVANHGGTVYARFAAMQLAALAVRADELAEAESHLREALAAGSASDELGQLIQLRLARVLAAAGDDAAALKILDAGSEAYAAAYATAKGDLHLAAGRDEEALDAYREARTVTLALGNPPGLLDIKISSLESRVATGASS